MRINQNVAAYNAWRNLSVTDGGMNKSLEKLSSGFRINRAADDAAGLAVSEKMRAQVRGLNKAIGNAQDGISLIQTAEGALNETHSILQRMRELAVQSSNDTLQGTDRTQLQTEITGLISEISRISTATQFNGKNLLNGSFSAATFQIGANPNQTVAVAISDLSATALAVDAVDVGSKTAASAAMTALDTAIDSVSTARANLGAVQNRLEHTIANLGVAAENLSAAESRVRDVDMAKEMSEFTRTQILMQAGTAMLAQANMKPQTVLKLLG